MVLVVLEKRKICNYGHFVAPKSFQISDQTQHFYPVPGEIDGEFGNRAASRGSSGNKKTIWRLNLRKAIIQNVCMGQMRRVTAHSGIRCDRRSASAAGLLSFSAVINSSH